MVGGWTVIGGIEAQRQIAKLAGRHRQPQRPPTPSRSKTLSSRAESPDFPELDTSQFGLKARRARELAEQELDDQEFDVVFGPDPDDEQEDRTWVEEDEDAVVVDGPSDIRDRDWPAEKIVDKRRHDGRLQYKPRWEPSLLLDKDLRRRPEGTFVRCDGVDWEIEREEPAHPDINGKAQVTVYWLDAWRPLQDLKGCNRLIQEYEDSQGNDVLVTALERLNHPEKGVDYTQCIRDYVRETNNQNTKGARKDLLDAVIRRATILRDSFVGKGDALSLIRDDKANAGLLHASGFGQTRLCTRCADGRGPFEGCVVGGPFKGACGNCGYASSAKMCEYHANPEESVHKWQAIREHRSDEHETQSEPAPNSSSSPVAPHSREPADRSSIDPPDAEPDTDQSSPPEVESPFTAFLNRERASDFGFEFRLPAQGPALARDTPRSSSRAAAVTADTLVLNTLSPSRQNSRSLQSREQTQRDRPESHPPDPLSIRDDDDDYFTIIDDVDDVCGSVFNDTSDDPAAASTPAPGPSSTAAQKRKRSSTSSSHSPAASIKHLDRHEGCRGGLEPCSYYTSLHPTNTTALTIPAGHTFTAGEASDAEVRHILSHASCDDIDFFLGVWEYWKETRRAKRRGSEVPSRAGTPTAGVEDVDVDMHMDDGGYTMERYLSCAASEWLNEIVEGMQKARGPRGKEVAGKGAGSQADPVVLDD